MPPAQGDDVHSSQTGLQKQGKAVKHRGLSQSSASREGSHHSSFCSAPSDGQSSRQQGASTSTPSDWLSLLAKAHGIGWAKAARSKGWPMVEAAELPFSCWVATSGVQAASSEGFGGLLDGGGGDVCVLLVGAFFTGLTLAGISLPLPLPAPTDTTCMLNPPLPRIGLFPAHWPTTMPAISSFPP